MKIDSFRFAIIASATASLLCGCGSKDSSGAGGSGGSNFSLGAKSPGNEVVDAFNEQIGQGNLDPILELQSLPDTTAATRELARNRLAGATRVLQANKARVTLDSEKVTGDLATVYDKLRTIDASGRETITPRSQQLLRTNGKWHFQNME